MQSLRQLIVATDFSERSEAALDLAVCFAKLGSAAITLVHVCQVADDDDASEEQVLQACRLQLLAACARRASSGVSITPLLRCGQIADKIHNVATEVGARLIVLGRGERGRLGETTERVLRGASRAVVVVGTDSFPLEMPE